MNPFHKLADWIYAEFRKIHLCVILEVPPYLVLRLKLHICSLFSLIIFAVHVTVLGLIILIVISEGEPKIHGVPHFLLLVALNLNVLCALFSDILNQCSSVLLC